MCVHGDKSSSRCLSQSKSSIRFHESLTIPVVSRGEEGRALLEECFLISEKFKGKEHPSLVPHLVNLATSHSRSKNFAEAARLLRISLQIVMKAVPPDDPSITFPMLHLAVTLYNLHRDEEAERLALDALCIREKAFGKESLPVGKPIVTSTRWTEYAGYMRYLTFQFLALWHDFLCYVLK